MTYGNFSPDGREFIIDTPVTPRPWANYLTNGRYCALISQTGGGYSFVASSGYHRITRAHPALMVLEDRPGRYLYIRDDETGRFWTINWQPVQVSYQTWQARHGLGYTSITSAVDGIRGEVTFFVPVDHPLEVWSVRLVNESGRPRHLSIFSYVEWCLGSYGFDLLETSFANLFKRLSYRDGVLTAGMRLWNVGHGPSKPHLPWDKCAFMSAGFPVVSYDGLREMFQGNYRSLANPLAVERGRCSDTLIDGQDSVAALHGQVGLAPGGDYAFTVTVGAVDREEEILPLARHYRDPVRVVEELERVKSFWDDYLGRVWVRTPDPDFDLSVNIWNKYQCWVTFNWSRMASYYIGGGSIVGFRDSSQDLLGVLPIDDSWGKEKLETMWRHQFRDGGTLHNWDPITDLGPRTGHSDDALWPVLATVFYLKETGDLSFLDRAIPYYDEGEGTVLEHINKSLAFTLGRRSPRGIPLMGEADWNDGLDQVGIEGRGESVMTAEFLCWMLWEVAAICRTRGDEEQARTYEDSFNDVSERVNRYCWDGEWYTRGTTDHGRVFGSRRNRYGQIYLNAQSWAVLSGVAAGERALSCLDSVKEKLDTEYGPCIFLPAYEMPDDEIGIITMFAPGVKENGTIFNHPVTWYIIAEAMLKRERAFEVWKRSSFITRGRHPDLYKTEPYVYAEYVYGRDSALFGQGEYTWTTGTAAWMFRACLDWILGVRPELDGLRVDPVIPAHWDGFTVRRRFRGAVYEIIVTNPQRVSSGIASVTVNGERREDSDPGLIPPLPEGIHTVEVVMGGPAVRHAQPLISTSSGPNRSLGDGRENQG